MSRLSDLWEAPHVYIAQEEAPYRGSIFVLGVVTRFPQNRLVEDNIGIGQSLPYAMR